MECLHFFKNLEWRNTDRWINPSLLFSENKVDAHSGELPKEVRHLASIKGSKPSVIIIGAGAAGMYAASLLQAKGIQVRILESSNRRGGRIKTLHEFADFGVEVGAEEIHGHNSIWFEWILSEGGKFVNYPSVEYYRLDGLLKPKNQIVNDPDVIAAWKIINNYLSYSGPDITVKSHADNLKLPHRVRHLLERYMGNEWGTDNNHLSIKGLVQEEKASIAGKANFTLKNLNFAEVLDAKCSNILPYIQYKTKVIHIEYQAESQAKVQDQEGTWYSADAIIVTVPLPVLKNNTITFSPALPLWKTSAIQNIGMGAGIKIILKFRQRFWANNLHYLISDLLSTVFWYTSKQRGEEHLLTAFVMGKNAEILSAQGKEIINTIISELDNMYQNNVATKHLVASHIEDWGANPHIGGAYSFPIVGGGGLKTRKDLYKAVGNKVFFAGEATNYNGHNSTVHGALETGQLAAKAVWQLYGV